MGSSASMANGSSHVLISFTLLCLLLASSALSALQIAPVSHASAQDSVSTNTSSIVAYVPITIANNQSASTSTGFQEMILFNPSFYSTYEASDLGNIRFCADSSCNTQLYAWLESCTPSCGPSATSATAWVNLGSETVPTSNSITIYMVFYPTSGTTESEFDGIYWGEAPTLSLTYAEFDNGPSVFALYDNFNGNSINSTIWNTESGAGGFTVNNGISFAVSTPGIGCFVDDYENDIYSKTTFDSPVVVEAYGELNTPQESNQTQCILGGVGFVNGRLAGQPAMISGWDQGSVNNFGLTVCCSSLSPGNYYYSDSPSTSQGTYTIFGLGFISESETVSYINEKESASSSQPMTSSPLNAVLGFQGNDFILNNYYWIRVRAYPPNGVMPTLSFGPATVPSAYVGNDNAEFATCGVHPFCLNTPSDVAAAMTITKSLDWSGKSSGSIITLQYNPDFLSSYSYQKSILGNEWFQAVIFASQNSNGLSCFYGSVQIWTLIPFKGMWNYSTPADCIRGGFNAGAVWSISEQVDPSSDNITGVAFSVTTLNTAKGSFAGFIGSAEGLPIGYKWLKSNLCLCGDTTLSGVTINPTFTQGGGTITYTSNVNLNKQPPPSVQLGDGVETLENSNIEYSCLKGSGSMQMSQSFGLSKTC